VKISSPTLCRVEKQLHSRRLALANRIEKWYQNLNNLIAYNDKNGCYPSTLSEDAVEKALAIWWARQKHLLKQQKSGRPCSLDERQIVSVESVVVRNSHLERDNLWNSRFEKISSQFEKNGKLFSINSDDIEEVKIMRWWNQQKTLLRKFVKHGEASGMNQERFDKISSLMRSMDIDIPATAEPVANNC